MNENFSNVPFFAIHCGSINQSDSSTATNCVWNMFNVVFYLIGYGQKNFIYKKETSIFGTIGDMTNSV